MSYAATKIRTDHRSDKTKGRSEALTQPWPLVRFRWRLVGVGRSSGRRLSESVGAHHDADEVQSGAFDRRANSEQCSLPLSTSADMFCTADM